MIPYNQFKESLGVKSIVFSKSLKTGREFTTINTLSTGGVRVKTEISLSPKLDKTKPLFVTFIEEHEGKTYNMYVVCNAAGVEQGSEL